MTNKLLEDSVTLEWLLANQDEEICRSPAEVLLLTQMLAFGCTGFHSTNTEEAALGCRKPVRATAAALESHGQEQSRGR